MDTIVSHWLVQDLCSLPGWSVVSDGHGGQTGGEIVAHPADGFQSHIAGELAGPLVGLFPHNSADQGGTPR